MAKQSERNNKIFEPKTSRKRLTEAEKKKCIAAYLSCGTYLGASQKTGFAIGTIKNCIKADPDFVNKFNKKREEEMQELFGSISTKGKKFAKFVEQYFDLLLDEAVVRRVAFDDLEKLARIFGITLDKFMLLNKVHTDISIEGDSNVTIEIVSKKRRGAEEDDDE